MQVGMLIGMSGLEGQDHQLLQLPGNEDCLAQRRKDAKEDEIWWIYLCFMTWPEIFGFHNS
jgi:hypothetical protein